MKKPSSWLLGIALALFLLAPLSAHAQSTEAERLYQEFLEILKSQESQTQQPSSQPAVMPQEDVQVNIPATPAVREPQKTSDYSLTGRVSRAEGGRYFITTDEKPSRVLRVYGTKTAKEVMHSVVYEKVQLIGEKAFYNGKEVGISANQVVPLVVNPSTPKKTPEVAKTPAPEVKMMHQESVFTGEIEVAEGKAYLVMMENKKRITRRLLNEADWKKAFQMAFKGTVRVKGFLTESGAIRYSEITR
ncbi:MAG: hypothetical protein AB7J40_00655 [Candidatus Altimarinota bacterium]